MAGLLVILVAGLVVVTLVAATGFFGTVTLIGLLLVVSTATAGLVLGLSRESLQFLGAHAAMNGTRPIETEIINT